MHVLASSRTFTKLYNPQKAEGVLALILSIMHDSWHRVGAGQTFVRHITERGRVEDKGLRQTGRW